MKPSTATPSQQGDLKEDYIRRISSEFTTDQWMELGTALGLNVIRLNCVKFNFYNKGNHESCYQMLKLWLQTPSANLQCLHEALRKIDRTDVITQATGDKKIPATDHTHVKHHPPKEINLRRNFPPQTPPPETPSKRFKFGDLKPQIVSEQKKLIRPNPEIDQKLIEINGDTKLADETENIKIFTSTPVSKQIKQINKKLPNTPVKSMTIEKTTGKTPVTQKTHSSSSSSCATGDLTDDLLRNVSNHINNDEWMTLGKELKFKPMKMNLIKFNHINKGSQEICYQILKAWRDGKEYEATRDKLHAALKSMEKEQALTESASNKAENESCQEKINANPTPARKLSLQQITPFEKSTPSDSLAYRSKSHSFIGISESSIKEDKPAQPKPTPLPRSSLLSVPTEQQPSPMQPPKTIPPKPLPRTLEDKKKNCKVDKAFVKIMPADVHATRKSLIEREFEKIIPPGTPEARKSLIEIEFGKIVPFEILNDKDRHSSTEELEMKPVLRKTSVSPLEVLSDDVFLEEESKDHCLGVSQNVQLDTNDVQQQDLKSYPENIRSEITAEQSVDLVTDDNVLQHPSSVCEAEFLTVPEFEDVFEEENETRMEVAGSPEHELMNVCDEAISDENSFRKLQKRNYERFLTSQACWLKHNIFLTSTFLDLSYPSLNEEGSVDQLISVANVFTETVAVPKKIMITSDTKADQVSFVSKLVLDCFYKEDCIWSAFQFILLVDLSNYNVNFEALLVKEIENLDYPDSTKIFNLINSRKDRVLLVMYNFDLVEMRFKSDLLNFISTCDFVIMFLRSKSDISMGDYCVKIGQISESFQTHPEFDYYAIETPLVLSVDKQYEICVRPSHNVHLLINDQLNVDDGYVDKLSDLCDINTSELYDNPFFLTLLVSALSRSEVQKLYSKTKLYECLFDFINNSFTDNKNISEPLDIQKSVDVFNGDTWIQFGKMLWENLKCPSIVENEKITFTKFDFQVAEVDPKILLKLGVIIQAPEFPSCSGVEYFELLHKTLSEFLAVHYLIALSNENDEDFQQELKHLVKNDRHLKFSCSFFNFLGGKMKNEIGLLLCHLEPWRYMLHVDKYPLREILYDISNLQEVMEHLIPFFPPTWHVIPSRLKQELHEVEEANSKEESFQFVRRQISYSFSKARANSVDENDETASQNSNISNPHDKYNLDQLSELSQHSHAWNVCSFPFYASELHKSLIKEGTEKNKVLQIIWNPLEDVNLPSVLHVKRLILTVSSLHRAQEFMEVRNVPENFSCDELVVSLDTCSEEDWSLSMNVVNAIKAESRTAVISNEPEPILETLCSELAKDRSKNLKFENLKILGIFESKGKYALNLIENLLKKEKVLHQLEVHIENWNTTCHADNEISIKREDIERFLNTVANVQSLEQFCLVADEHCKSTINARLHMSNFFSKHKTWKSFYVDGRFYCQQTNNTDDNLSIKLFGFNSDDGHGNKINVLAKFSDIRDFKYCTASLPKLLNDLPGTWTGFLTLQTLHLDVSIPKINCTLEAATPLPNLHTLILDFRRILHYCDVRPCDDLAQISITIKILVFKTVRKWNVPYVERFLSHMIMVKKFQSNYSNDDNTATANSFDDLFGLHRIKLWFDQTHYISEEMLQNLFQNVAHQLQEKVIKAFCLVEPDKFLDVVDRYFPVGYNFNITREIEDANEEEILYAHHQREYRPEAPDTLAITYNSM